PTYRPASLALLASWSIPSPSWPSPPSLFRQELQPAFGARPRHVLDDLRVLGAGVERDVLLHLVQVRQRPLQFTLEVPHPQQALDPRQQLELVHRLADEVVRPALRRLLDVPQFV